MYKAHRRFPKAQDPSLALAVLATIEPLCGRCAGIEAEVGQGVHDEGGTLWAVS